MNAPTLAPDPVRLVLCAGCARSRGLPHRDGWRELAVLLASGFCDDCRAAFCMCSSSAARVATSSRCVVTVARGWECPRRSSSASAVVAALFVYERGAS